MFVYLFSVLIAASTWPGVWKISAEHMQGGFETYYLVIQDETTAHLYDKQWYPQLVKTFELDDTRVKMGINFEGVVVPTVLEGKGEGKLLNGTITFSFPQYEIKSKFSADRVLGTPIPPPADHLPCVIEGNTVDLVRYLTGNAPKEGFDKFAEFWKDDFVPRYFVLIEPLLPKAEGETEKTLKLLYESLAKLEKKVGEGAAAEAGVEADFTVLVPVMQDQAPFTVEIASEKAKWPPDYKPCCGDKLFRIKKFRLIPITP